MVDVTVGIKALNEEKHIAEALRSALEATASVEGEVILADSGSTDRTIAIAEQYESVRIFQLANPHERSCGVGAQLAFQHARGRYFYILDGDMVLSPVFMKAGIEFLERNAEFAAVGGIVEQVNLDGEEYRIRQAVAEQDAGWQPGIVDRLDCGGLYRTSAISELGYFADRNLHSFEEFELGARLRSRGWKLARLNIPAVKHYGHTTGGYRLLQRRFKSGYIDGAGEVFRSAIGHKHVFDVFKRLGHIPYGIVTLLWWLLVVCLIVFAPVYAAIVALVSFGLLCVRRKSVQLGLYSFVMWNIYAIGLVRGFFRTRSSPTKPIASVEHRRTPSESAHASVKT